MPVGYYARATENKHSTVHTKVHFIIDREPICGYKPHKTMQFQWCSNSDILDWIECKKCKEKVKRIYYSGKSYQKM